MSAPENPPAFPNQYEFTMAGEYCHENGMTLRDWFAGQALVGLCANPELLKQMPAVQSANPKAGDLDAMLSTMAGNIADAMLAARKPVQEPVS